MKSKSVKKTVKRVTAPTEQPITALRGSDLDAATPSLLFTQLVQQLTPHGTEQQYWGAALGELKFGTDDFGNYVASIGQSQTIFAAHLDTVSASCAKPVLTLDDDVLRTDGSSILGADDRAGVTCLLWLYKHRVPGLYYLFVGEERGCIGSSQSANKYDFSRFKRMVSFDRRGFDGVITEQSTGECCSDEFAEALSEALNLQNDAFRYEPDPTGIYTDSAEFVTVIPECTNISVGYLNEHTCDESQNLTHLERLCAAIVKLDWENLPTERDPNQPARRQRYSYGGTSHTGYTDDDDGLWPDTQEQTAAFGKAWSVKALDKLRRLQNDPLAFAAWAVCHPSVAGELLRSMMFSGGDEAYAVYEAIDNLR